MYLFNTCKMLILLVLLYLNVSAYTNPIQDVTDTAQRKLVQHPLKILTTARNYRNVMEAHILSEYDLSRPLEEYIKTILSDFYTSFEKDLWECVAKQDTNATAEVNEVIDDGFPDDSFNNIRDNVRLDFPGINEKTVSEIVFKFRKNLFLTKRSVDLIILESKKAYFRRIVF